MSRIATTTPPADAVMPDRHPKAPAIGAHKFHRTLVTVLVVVNFIKVDYTWLQLPEVI